MNGFKSANPSKPALGAGAGDGVGGFACPCPTPEFKAGLMFSIKPLLKIVEISGVTPPPPIPPATPPQNPARPSRGDVGRSFCVFGVRRAALALVAVELVTADSRQG